MLPLRFPTQVRIMPTSFQQIIKEVAALGLPVEAAPARCALLSHLHLHPAAPKEERQGR